MYANDNGSKMYAPYQYDEYWQAKGWKAIAAVVVPARYTPDSTIRAMSLVNMDCANFDQGGITGPKKDVDNNKNTDGQSCLHWGPTGSTVIKNIKGVSAINPKGDITTISLADYAYLPRDHKYNGSVSGNSGDVDAWWWTYSPVAPSPYGNQSAYSKEGQVLADMDGRGNTDTVLKHVPASAFTMTNGLSPNPGQSGDTETFNVPENYPPFTLCARYYTTGTVSAKTDSTSGYKSLGSWYLPSAGELGYLVVRQGLIFNACENVKVDGTNNYGYGIWLGRDYQKYRPGTGCWSSSEYSADRVWSLSFDYGRVTCYWNFTKVGRSHWVRVRAFAAF